MNRTSITLCHVFYYSILTKDWKIEIYRRYFIEILDISHPWYDIHPRLSIPGNIVKKSAKSPIYRRSTDKSKINREWSWRVEQSDENFKKSPIFRYFYRFFEKFPDISYQSSLRTTVQFFLFFFIFIKKT